MLPFKLPGNFKFAPSKIGQLSARVASKFAGKSMFLLTKDPFWVLVIASAGAHTAFWFLWPNPIKQAERPKMEVISTVPVVSLPPQKLAALQKNTKLDLSVPPVSNPLAILPLNTSKNFNLIDPSSVENLPSAALPYIPALKPVQPEITQPNKTPKSEIAESQNSDRPLTIKDKLAIQRQLEADTKLALDDKTNNPDKSASTPANNTDSKSDRNTPAETSSPREGVALKSGEFNRELSNVYAEYSGKNIIRSVIPAPDELVSQASQSIEPGVAWIPPVKQPDSKYLNKRVKITVALVVSPNGKVERKLMQSSGIDNLDNIVIETVEGYEGKFQPLQGKYRFVTIKYNFPTS